jgi:beta-galactosidase
MLGVTLKTAPADFSGSLSVPDWPEARGLSASDLRWRTHLDAPPWVVSASADIGADGLIGRKVIGKGVVVFCQVDPDRFHADEKTYFRYTRWRATRAVAQLLANLGASFTLDGRIFERFDEAAFVANGGLPDSLADRPGPQATGVERAPMSRSPKPRGNEPPGYYYPDYRTDFPMGDNPYRYYRW